jgi:hypothetical protein
MHPPYHRGILIILFSLILFSFNRIIFFLLSALPSNSQIFVPLPSLPTSVTFSTTSSYAIVGGVIGLLIIVGLIFYLYGVIKAARNKVSADENDKIIDIEPSNGTQDSNISPTPKPFEIDGEPRISLKELSMVQVQDLFININLLSCIGQLQAHSIDGEMLDCVETEQDLIELGISLVTIVQRKLIKKILEFQEFGVPAYLLTFVIKGMLYFDSIFFCILIFNILL